VSDIASPSEVMLGSGQTVTLDNPAVQPVSSPSARQAYRSVIDTFPGQVTACPLCGSWAHEAPEGIHGTHAPADSLNSVGDPVWKYEHCFKCGYRNDSSAVVREAEMYQLFRTWLAQQTAKDLQHQSLNPPTTSDDMKALTDLANRLGVTINPISSVPVQGS
jgi:hypothetical protein